MVLAATASRNTDVDDMVPNSAPQAEDSSRTGTGCASGPGHTQDAVRHWCHRWESAGCDRPISCYPFDGVGVSVSDRTAQPGNCRAVTASIGKAGQIRSGLSLCDRILPAGHPVDPCCVPGRLAQVGLAQSGKSRERAGGLHSYSRNSVDKRPRFSASVIQLRRL